MEEQDQYEMVTVRPEALDWAELALQAYYVKERDEGNESAARMIWKALAEIREVRGDRAFVAL